MLSRKTFNKLSNSLEWGFFADEMILILLSFKKKKKLPDSNKETIKKAINFLKDAVKGHNWMDSNTFKNQKSAFAFSQAVKVLSKIETSDEFLSYMEQLIQTAEKIQKSKKVEKKEINNLIDFFTDYGKTQLEISEDIINGNGIYSRWHRCIFMPKEEGK